MAHWSDEIEGCDEWRAHARKFATMREAWRSGWMKLAWYRDALLRSKDRRVLDTLFLIDKELLDWSLFRDAILREFPDGPFISEPETKESSMTHDEQMKEAAHIEVWRQDKDYLVSEARVPRKGRIVIEMGDAAFAALRAALGAAAFLSTIDAFDIKLSQYYPVDGASELVRKLLNHSRRNGVPSSLFCSIVDFLHTSDDLPIRPAPPKDCKYDSEGATVYSLNHPRRLSESDLEAMLAEVRRRKEEAR